MASIFKEKGSASYRLEYRDRDKQRRKIRLGRISKKDAQAVAYHVESIVSTQVAGSDSPPRATAEWLTKISNDLHGKLAELGLTKPRLEFTLGEWLEHFIRSHEKKISGGTFDNLEQAQKKLEAHFSSCSMLADITPERAQGFREWLKTQGYAEATIAKHVVRAKQFFNAAVKAGVIIANPFADVAAGSQVNKERSAYIPAGDIEKAIEMAPDAQWRLIIALSRYGGLRCPSEVLALRWADIDFTAGVMRITSSKLERYGKGSRQMPILPELRPYLEEAFAPENEFCITRYRESSSNLRTQFHRIITKAGLTPWPRAFHNLRGSLETDLLARFPIHVVTAWLGNSPKIALAHYAKITPEDVAKATGKAPAWVVGKPGVNPGVGVKTGVTLAEFSPLKLKADPAKHEKSVKARYPYASEIAVEGLDSHRESQSEKQVVGVELGVGQELLAELLKLWSRLTTEQQGGIVAQARAEAGGGVSKDIG
jgi:integrase